MANELLQLKNIAIIGGGPAGLFLYRQLIEDISSPASIHIFEAKNELGTGMPYSPVGAGVEHITNVSGNEIPRLSVSLTEWIQQLPAEKLFAFGLDGKHFSEFKVVPRLLFGEYLRDQFEVLQQQASDNNFKTTVHLNTSVIDIIDRPLLNKTVVVTKNAQHEFDTVIICTGHCWPKTNEGKVPGYFDSPYPPSKLKFKANHAVAIRGSSLTAIDAVRTLARENGKFEHDKQGDLKYYHNEDAKNFKLILHSRQGLLPGIRFHLDDPRLAGKALLTKEEVKCHMKENGGFVSLNYIFEKDFKEQFSKKGPAFYEKIRPLSLEDFVDHMMSYRENVEPFELFKIEYNEAARSIRRHESVYWKEMLATLSFALNYPAKYLSAEDTLRLQKVLMPLISIVIAFVPQSSCEELIALHEAGKLALVSVGDDSKLDVKKDKIIYRYTDEKGEQENSYQAFIDCIGQPHLNIEDFPFKSMVENETVTAAALQFRSNEEAGKLAEGNDKVFRKAGDYFLKVPGVAIGDHFQVIGKDGRPNPRIYMMAVPFIGGFNPDYSGLDFCEEAGKRVAGKIKELTQFESPHN